MEIADVALHCFDHETRKGIEEKARRDAEADTFDEPIKKTGETYEAQLMYAALNYIYFQAFGKRKARLVRLKERA